ncbi:MAG TPA: radical SAM protein, partial [Marinilabiliaceae bacterium]|nr:radical SAM protein [Marinilabiliaceae bacterium]
LLAAKGVKEIQLIAQELTYYGLDIYKKRKLTTLIQEISKVEGIEWIRLHYAYPSGFPLDLLDEMAVNPKVCKYLDIALQHISNPMLKSMRRNVTTAQTLELIAQMRERVPGIHLRTTLITGHPNETQEDFEQLKEFVLTQKFDRLGVFPYSHEEDTFAHKNYKDNIPDEEKQERANCIMELQSEISLHLNQKKIGTLQKVIIDRLEDGFYVGRTQFDSPEVDPEVLISTTKPMIIGEFYEVTIIEAQEYDLLAQWG